MPRNEQHLTELKKALYHALLALQTNEITPGEICIAYDLARDPHIQQLLDHQKARREGKLEAANG
jgi:hypothetical protein